MKRFILTTVLATAVTVPLTMAQTGYDHRSEKQAARIKEGEASGEITKGEATKLAVQKKKMNKEVKRDAASGGGMSAGEKAQIKHQEKARSAEIAKDKHNDRTQ